MGKTTVTNQDWSNKVVVITGGSRGMGAAMAKAFGSRGATVALTYGKSADEAKEVVKAIEASGGKAEAVQADARKPETVAKVMADIGKKHGKVDVLINNAGVFLDSEMGSADATSNFEQMMLVNVHSVFTGTNALIPYLRDGGRIINLGSVAGHSALMPGLSGYAATKHAVAGLSSGWAMDLGPRKITVNTIEPGPINTDMNPETGDLAKMMLPQIPLRRYGQPDEVADLALFLASPDASYITGARVKISGGVEI